MNDKPIPSSELIINDDGSVFHLHILPEDLSDLVIMMGDPGRVTLVGKMFDTIEVGHPDFHLEFGIAERRAVRKQVSLDGGALFERRHQVFGIKRGRTRLEV